MIALEAPSSKSMTQRALIIAALSNSTTRIERPLVCDDSRHLTTLLSELGCAVTWHDDHAIVEPATLQGGNRTIFCGNAGTAVRFGSCLSLLTEGAFTIDGDAHMRTRPLGPLTNSLKQLGIDVAYDAAPGCPPVRLERRTAAADIPARVSVDASMSSQYASGLAMVAPHLPNGLRIDLAGDTVSRPYLTMTTEMMQRAGARVGWQTGGAAIVVEPSTYDCAVISVEADWSGAAFLLAAGSITGLDIDVPGLEPHGTSLQGDAVFGDMLSELRLPREHRFDLTDAPDLIAPLAAACLFASHPSQIRGAAHTRIKECDRITVLTRELSKLGAAIREHTDGMDIAPAANSASLRGATLDPEGDHRMAMTFGLVSLRVQGLEVLAPECVSKSFPHFWPVLDRIRSHLAETTP